MVSNLTDGTPVVQARGVGIEFQFDPVCGCSSVVEHLLAKERVESSNLFIRLIQSCLFLKGDQLTAFAQHQLLIAHGFKAQLAVEA